MRGKMIAALPPAALLIAGIVGWVYSQGTEELAKGPIVSNVRTDGATVTWITMRTIGRIRRAGGSAASLKERVFHQVEVSGLEPGTRQELDLGTEALPVRVSFVTPPLGDAPFRFIVYGDTRTRHDVHQRVVERVLGEKPDFLLHTGDLVSNGDVPEDWDRFFAISGNLLARNAFFPVLGNHERNNPIFAKYFAVPDGNVHHYSFDWGGAHFVNFTSMEIGSGKEEKDAFIQAQIEWLKADLAKNQKPLVFVSMHEPLYTAVERRTESAARVAARYEQVFLDGNVTAVFAGHDHNYQHHLVKGIHHIVAGGGGAPLYDVVPIPDVTIKAVKTENYVRVRVEGGKAFLEAVDLEGTVLDAFELKPRGAIKKAA